jgi:hypothetical protein
LSIGLAHSTPASSYSVSPDTAQKREVKEEDDIQAPQHRRDSNSGGIMFLEAKVEVKEEEKDKVGVTKAIGNNEE